MSESQLPANFLQHPKPPSRQETISNPTSTLAWIQSRLAGIYKAAKTDTLENRPPALDRSSYLDIYTAIHDFCIATRSGQRTLCAENLYRGLEGLIRDHCIDIQTHVLDLRDGGETPCQLTTTYLAQWNRFLQLAGVVSHLMQPMEQAWVKRQIDEGYKDIYLIRDLHSIVWQQEALGTDGEPTGVKEIANAAKVLEVQDKNGPESDKELTSTPKEQS